MYIYLLGKVISSKTNCTIHIMSIHMMAVHVMSIHVMPMRVMSIDFPPYFLIIVVEVKASGPPQVL